jgi:hypothetical protein
MVTYMLRGANRWRHEVDFKDDPVCTENYIRND